MSTDAPLTVDLAQLPNDVGLLKQLVLQLWAQLREKEGRIQSLEQRMDWLARRVFGRTREKLDPRQLALFDLLAADLIQDPPLAVPAPEATTPEVAPPARPKKPGHGRRPIPDTLERRDVIHDLTPEEKLALAGDGQLTLIGEEVTEQYEWEPACLFVIRHIQKKYARQPALLESGLTPLEKNMITAPKPPAPIPGGIAGPGLIAQVLVSHHVDHLPFHRQQNITARYGQLFSRQTMDGWSLSAAELFAPLVEQLQLDVVRSGVLHTDDTPVSICDAQGKQSRTGRFWIYLGDERHPWTVFDYTPDRSRDGPLRVLRGYQGFLQADAYGGYDCVYAASEGRILEVACWAHARRKFFEQQSQGQVYALTALAYIRQLYAVESDLRQHLEGDWKTLVWEERAAQVLAARQARSRPVLEKFKAWLDAESPKLLPKNGLREASQYVLGNWAAFGRYVEDGRLAIDNNAAERAIRTLAIGRNNWLFRGSDRGARAAAMHFSLAASCARHGRPPFEYFRLLLTELPKLGPRPSAEALRALFPDRASA